MKIYRSRPGYAQMAGYYRHMPMDLYGGATT